MSDTPKPDQPPVDTRPGYDIEIDGVRHRLSEPVKPEHGAQVVLTGLARTAARGGAAGDIHSNTVIRDLEIARGNAADGTTPDGSTPDARPAPDVVTQHVPFGPPGQGEGKPGFRPGDDAVQRAQDEAAQARQDARAAALEQVQQAASAPMPHPPTE